MPADEDALLPAIDFRSTHSKSVRGLHSAFLRRESFSPGPPDTFLEIAVPYFRICFEPSIKAPLDGPALEQSRTPKAAHFDFLLIA